MPLLDLTSDALLATTRAVRKRLVMIIRRDIW